VATAVAAIAAATAVGTAGPSGGPRTSRVGTIVAVSLRSFPSAGAGWLYGVSTTSAACLATGLLHRKSGQLV